MGNEVFHFQPRIVAALQSAAPYFLKQSTVTMREGIASIFRTLRPKIQFSSLSAFAGNLATCLSSGLKVPESLETSTRSSPDAALRGAGPVAAENARSGKPLSESLEFLDEHLPSFFLSVLRCGEQSGRTDEALNYLRGHCSLLDRPNRMMRNMWLAPLLLFGLGSIVVAAAYFVFAPLLTAMEHLLRTIVQWVAFLALVVAVVNVPALRRVWDQVLLIIPYFGETVRAMAHDRFFNAFNLLYCTGGIPVAEMVRLASTTVDNAVVREDLLRPSPGKWDGACRGFWTGQNAQSPNSAFSPPAKKPENWRKRSPPSAGERPSWGTGWAIQKPYALAPSHSPGKRQRGLPRLLGGPRHSIMPNMAWGVGSHHGRRSRKAGGHGWAVSPIGCAAESSPDG